MHAVVRETFYAPGQAICDVDEFQEFQELHSLQGGYQGTVMVDVGDGRYLTLTLWQDEFDMKNARNHLTEDVERLLEPMMTRPSKLLGTGPVVLNDLEEYYDGD